MKTLTGPAFMRQVVRIQEEMNREHDEALERAAKYLEERKGGYVGLGLNVLSLPELADELRALKRGGARG